VNAHIIVVFSDGDQNELCACFKKETEDHKIEEKVSLLLPTLMISIYDGTCGSKTECPKQ
jgi:hypothetical protein